MRQEMKERDRESRREASPDDIERYKFIKEQHERMEEERRRHALKVPGTANTEQYLWVVFASVVNK